MQGGKEASEVFFFFFWFCFVVLSRPQLGYFGMELSYHAVFKYGFHLQLSPLYYNLTVILTCMIDVYP